MQRSIRLRPWQKEALDRFVAAEDRDFLAVATPGAGKTTFALTAALAHLGEHPADRVIVVAPTRHLKLQWTAAAARLGLHLEPEWSPRDGCLPPDMHGIVTTYQQVAGDPASVRAISGRAFVVLDELHHAGDERAWGDGIRLAFGNAPRRLALSGTPFRSDTAAIPFVHYDGFGEARPQYEYGYGEALVDGGVVRPVYFPRIDGEMEWVAPDGSEHSATFADALDPALAGQRLRTALALEGEWLPAVLDQAHAQLLAIRSAQPHAGGLVIAMDHDHARGIVELMRRRLRVQAELVLSDDPSASDRIEAFAESSAPWLVAVRMVSEGVDIPRLRVGVFATNTTTELFFRQAAGRLVRWTRGMRHQRAFLFIPDDARLRTYAARVAEQRRHSLRRRDDGTDDRRTLDAEPDAVTTPRQEEQLSLFAPISAVALGDPHSPDWLADEPDGRLSLDELDDPDGTGSAAERDDGLTISLLAPPRPGAPSIGGALAGDGIGPVHRTRREHKAHLRSQNADRARDIVRRSGLAHSQVNRELNRLAGVTRVSEATVEQLERRLRAADRWLTTL
jgi:superfamily II DNA or RNA helicase